MGNNGATESAWFYVNERTIDVIARAYIGTGVITAARLTRKQLVAALAAMDKGRE